MGMPRRQVEAQGPAGVPVHHRNDPRRARPAACDAAAAGHDPHPRDHPQTRPPSGRRDRPDPVRDGAASSADAGSCPSRSRSSASSPEPARPGRGGRYRPRRQASGGHGRQHRRDQLRAATPSTSTPRWRSCAACPAVSPDARAPTGAPGASRRSGGTRPTPNATGSTTAWRTSAPTRCTSSPPRIRAEYGTVVVEDLNVAGMLRNRRLARKIADAGFGEIRRQLTYKGRAGRRASPWSPTAGSPPRRPARTAAR